ncbi:MAG: UDP-N-acetyl-alpha-D-muramoyl-L-alanyl-L-glutamat e epimerase [Rickettsiales bacterium]|nr:MAG: UDP-N-acetyl-alpha-D-muramoyl-L-alanyl-L-glutamat e epimerase [Rickettsiales bacterium]
MTEHNFTFSKYEFVDTTLKLYYNTDNYEFIEEIDFHKSPTTDEQRELLDIAFQYLHLAAGVSYYKNFVPKNIVVDTCVLSKAEAEFFNNLYFNGLGEFSYKNQLLLDINFPFEETDNKTDNILYKLSNNIIIPIGGGKDSLVVYNKLKKEKPDSKFYTFSVNNAKPIEDSCLALGEEHIIINRKIAPTLLELVKNEVGYNGHVPISAIIALISVCAGIIYDCNTTAIANEKSANVGNIEWQGRLVNHQWSKSEEAEIALRDFIKKYITSEYTYYSPIRPYYEIAIAKKFSELKQYHSIFSSCNKNFKISADKSEKVWCCDCPKCRFVYLILAPFMQKDDMIEIFGKNLLDEESQLDGYEELAGLHGHKPFECVGEIEESALSFLLLKDTEYKDDAVVKSIVSRLNGYDVEKLKDIYLKNSL